MMLASQSIIAIERQKDGAEPSFQSVKKLFSYAGGNGKVFGRAFFKKLVGVQRATPSGRAPQCAKRKGSRASSLLKDKRTARSRPSFQSL